MKRSLVILLSIMLGIVPSVFVAAQGIIVPSFPSAGVIRGEYIRLRAEPAAEAPVLMLLERGDGITITGEAEAADGFIFYPVEVVRTGDAGWVRELFIDPDTIAPVLDLGSVTEPEVEPEPEEIVPPPAAEEDDTRRERPRRERRNRNAEEPAVEEPAAEEPAAEEPVAQDSAAEELPPDAEPEPEPTPEEPAVEPEPDEPADDPADEPAENVVVAVAGEGAMATEPFTLEEGRYRITATLEATEATEFVVNLLGPRDFNEPLFADEIDSAQSWTVRTSVTIDRAGEYVIEVAEAAGDWTVEFEAR